MLERLIAFSIRRRGLVVVLACMALVYGIYAAFGAKLDVFPEFAPPQVVIRTFVAGLEPEQVEQLVTRPIELAVSGTPNLATLRSQSVAGLSIVTAVFRDGADVRWARQQVSERLAQVAGQLPSSLGPPEVAPLTSTTSTALSIGLTSDSKSEMDVRGFADWNLRPALLGVPGVAKVAIFGGEVRQLQIQIRPARLAAFGLTVGDLVAAARKATGVRGAGFVETPSQRILLAADGQSSDPASLGAVPLVRRNGTTVRLRDVATVAWGAEPKLGDAAVMGKPGVVLVVSSQLGANTLQVTRELERMLKDLAPAAKAQGITLWPALFRPATFVETAISNLDTSLIEGAILVALVLFAFLWNGRTAVISLSAIPLSLLVALAILVRSGATLNTMTLGGLAIAIGEVVDDAIIDVENVHRRLKENRVLAVPRPAYRVILDASLEVRGSMVFATFVVILVFVPVLLMSGVQGRLFAPLGEAYILAVLASLAVALTVTPALCAALLARERGDRVSPFLPALRARYERLLHRTLQRPRLVMGVAGALMLAAVATLPLLGGSFLPELHEGQFIVHMSAVPGTALAETMRLGEPVMAALMREPAVQTVSQTAGTTQDADDVLGPQDSEFDVALKPLEGDEADQAAERIRKLLTGYPGVSFSQNSFLSERLDETLSGQTAPVAIQVFGDSLDAIDRAAADVARVLGKVPGATGVRLASVPGVPQLTLHLKAEALAQFGMPPVDALDALQTVYQGTTVGQVFAGDHTTDVAVVGAPALRSDPLSATRLLLRNADGERVPLGTLAAAQIGTGRYMVAHDGGRREQTVTCNVRGRDLAGFVAEAREAIARRVKLPSGLYLAFSGAAEARSQAQRELLLYSALAGTGIVLLLAVAFRNARNLLLVLANLPFALVGGVLAALATGGNLSVGSLVGFVTLFGITTRNSIMLISRYSHLCEAEGVTWGAEAAVRGAAERLSPILMTALVTGLGLLPVAIGSGTAGREVEGPMAIVILGGLLTSTLLNLLVLPTLALRFGRFAPEPEAVLDLISVNRSM